jgi:hypothetical protein
MQRHFRVEVVQRGQAGAAAGAGLWGRGGKNVESIWDWLRPVMVITGMILI